jgi:DNA-binding helix-hairpin-helix protein with protein kinase domain
VIGDISGRNLMVRKDATVCWIDSDSFLIGNPYFTEIGRLVTPEWTPPELQGNKHLHTPRLPGHDRFGLAVLIFHILMLGRHPFQGRYTGQGEVPDIQTYISQRWYAHAGYNAIPLQPPIGTPPISHLGSKIVDLFSKAFFESAPGRRPSAKDWIEALKNLERNFQRCQKFSGHYFSAAAEKCPWCQVLPDYGNFDFFAGAATQGANGVLNPAHATQSSAEIAAFITQLGVPSDIPNAVYRPATGQGLPTWHYSTPGWLGSIFTSRASEAHKLEIIKTRFEGQATLLRNQLVQNLYKQQTWLNSLSGVSRKFVEMQAEASRKLGDATLRQSARMQLEAPALNHQRAMYLARFRIKPGEISGFGEKRIAELAGHGIVTAADVTRHGIRRIPGFGESLVSSIEQWRKGKEKAFRPGSVNLPQVDIERRARELLARLKPEFQNRKETLIREVYKLTNDARACAGEAATIQQQLDVVVANIAAVNQTLQRLA